MTTSEKKLFALGAGAGILAAALAVGIILVRERPSFASGVAMLSSRPEAAPPAPARAVDQGTQPGSTVDLSPAEITAAGVQVAEVRTALLKTGIDAFGRVEQPEAQLAAVSARIGGRVDKLFVQYTGERVQRGQAIAELYSPEVATAVEEYNLAQQTRDRLRPSPNADARAQAEALVDASRRKLELWGVAGKDADAANSAAIPHVTLYAYASGTVVERKVTQGQYVNAGDMLFTVADLSQVWIKADVYEEQLAAIRSGQQVDITAEAIPGRTLHGHVDFIEPSANPQTRTVPVHVHVANPGMHLLPGMFISASFVSTSAHPSIVIPRSAVIDSGTRKIVYLARANGVFEAREVQVGAPSEELYPVVAGLSTGDKVVLNGNFLIDSQAHLSSGMAGLYGGSKEFAGGQQAQSAGTSTATRDEAGAAKIDLLVDPNPMKAGQNNQFQVKLADGAGKPIADAQVAVTLVMPAMPSMSMPEMKSSFELKWVAASQMYTGAGQAPMAGSWIVLAEARRGGNVIASSHTHINAR